MKVSKLLLVLIISIVLNIFWTFKFIQTSNESLSNEFVYYYPVTGDVRARREEDLFIIETEFPNGEHVKK